MNSIKQFSLLQGLFFSAWAAFAAFKVYYLREAGFTNTEIGFAVSVMMAMGVIGQTFWGYVCDRQQSVKKVFMFCMALLALIILFFPYYDTVLKLVAALGAVGFLWMPQQSIIDSWIFDSSRALGRSYGFMRAWGSLGFATVALVFGGLISVFGWNLMFVSHGVLAAAAIWTAYGLEDTYRSKAEAEGTSGIPRKVNPLELFANVDYVFLLAASILLFIPNRLAIQYMPEMLRVVGGTPAHQGVGMFVNAVSEVPILFTSKVFLTRFPSLTLLLFASFFFTIRLVGLYFAATPNMVIAAGVFQGLSFGVFLPTIRSYINDVAPDHLKTSAQSIATASFFGLSTVLGSFLGGYAIDTFGMPRTLLVGSVLSATAMMAVAVQFARRRR